MASVRRFAGYSLGRTSATVQSPDELVLVSSKDQTTEAALANTPIENGKSPVDQIIRRQRFIDVEAWILFNR
jgi:hypothetical protein